MQAYSFRVLLILGLFVCLHERIDHFSALGYLFYFILFFLSIWYFVCRSVQQLITVLAIIKK